MSDSQSPETSQEASAPNRKTYIWIIIGVVAAILLFAWMRGNQTPAMASMGGFINFNGLNPSDNPSSAASIKLMQRAVGTTQFVDAGIDIPVKDNAPWSWEAAEEGVTYEMVAYGFLGDQKIAETNSILSTAPANGLILTFNIEKADLPEGTLPEPEPETATVAGTVVINGFIPSGSVVNIYGRPSGDEEAEFQLAIEDIPASNGVTWSYENATAGQTYEYQAELYNSSGTFLGQSEYLIVTAPAANEVVVINSSAVPPTKEAAISGKVRLNGPVTQGSTILLLQRQAGQAEYSVIDRIPAVASTDWEWDGSVAGTTYDITAALQVNEANTATGNVVTVAAPAENVEITIDTGVNLPAPQNAPQVACGTPDGTNHFNATVSLPQIEGAKRYYLQVGTSAGASNTFSNTLAPNETARIYIPAESPYFTRYSYTKCADCDLNDRNNWAGWSPTYGFICEGPQATPYYE